MNGIDMNEFQTGGGLGNWLNKKVSGVFENKKVSSYHNLMAKYKCPYCRHNSIEVVCSGGFGSTSFFFCNRLECNRLISTGPASFTKIGGAGSAMTSKHIDTQIKEIDKKIFDLQKKVQEIENK